MDFGSPAFIGKRQQHRYNTVETKINFTPLASNEEIGFVIFQNESHFYFLANQQIIINQ